MRDGSTMLNAKASYSWLVCAHHKSMVAHVPRSGLFIRTLRAPTSSSSCAALSLLSCLRLLGWAQGMAQGAATTPRGPRGRNSRARSRSPPCQPAPWSASPSPCIRRRASPSGPLLPLLVRDAVTPTEEVKTEPTNQPHAPSSSCAVSTLRPASAFLSSISPFLRGDLCRGRM